MRYCVAHVLGEEVQEYFRAMTSDLAGRFGVQDLSQRIKAHITIRYPFDVDDATSVVETLRRCAAMHRSVPFAVEGFEHFPENTRTIFLGVRHDERFDTIAHVIARLLPLGDEGARIGTSELHPHVSIARHLDEGTFHSCWDYLATLPRPRFDSHFDAISLLRFEDDHWSEERRFSFHG